MRCLQFNMKKYKCKAKGCINEIERTNRNHVCCSAECAITYAVDKKIKEEQSKIRKLRKELNENDKKYMMKKAQTIFNKYIRLRDKDEACITCGHKGKRQMHAGHFKSVGGNNSLRFNEDNCHVQCSICNNHLSGNLDKYRENLIKKIGKERVDKLDEVTKVVYDIKKLSDIIQTYKNKIKEIQ